MTNERVSPGEREHRPIQAVIFDKDGILMITEGVYFNAWQQVIVHFGGNSEEYTWDYHMSCAGQGSAAAANEIRNKFGLTAEIDEMVAKFRETYWQIFENEVVEIPSGVVNLIKQLRSMGIKCVVATGASRKNADLTLKRLEIEFDAIVTSDDITSTKPNPEIFLRAAQMIGISPENCLVVGDSVNDLLAGKAAGMRVIHKIDREPVIWGEIKPDLEIRSIDQLNPEIILNLP